MKNNTPSLDSRKIGNKLWDIIMKSIAAHAPNQFLPLIQEIFCQEYPQNTSIDFLSTEYPTYSKSKEQYLSTIFADIVMLVSNKELYHFEWQTNKDERITVRMFEYDTHIALVHTLQKDFSNHYALTFPKSAIIFLGCNQKAAAHQLCELVLADGKVIHYKIPIIKVQDYSLEEIEKKHLCILLPFTLLRFRPRLYSKSHPLGKKELTDFVKRLIVILENEKTANYITQLQFVNYVQYIRMALEQVLSNRPKLLEEVLNMYYPMIIPSFDEQERMIADRDTMLAAKDTMLAVKDSTITKWREWAKEKGFKEEEFPQ